MHRFAHGRRVLHIAAQHAIADAYSPPGVNKRHNQASPSHNLAPISLKVASAELLRGYTGRFRVRSTVIVFSKDFFDRAIRFPLLEILIE